MYTQRGCSKCILKVFRITVFVPAGFRYEMFKSKQLVLRNPDVRGLLEHDSCKSFNFKDVPASVHGTRNEIPEIVLSAFQSCK